MLKAVETKTPCECQKCVFPTRCETLPKCVSHTLKTGKFVRFVRVQDKDFRVQELS